MKVLFINGVQSAFIADDFFMDGVDLIGVSGGQRTVYPAAAFGDAVVEIKDYTPPVPVPVKQVPQQVEMTQARLALLSRGLLDRVGAEIEAMEEPNRSAAKIEWEFRITIRRDNHLVLALGALLGLSADDLDDLFIEASKL